jgi:hypothetical protein
VDGEFIPRLNHEHIGYAWIATGSIPRPLHPGLYATIRIDAIKDKLKIIQDTL